MERDFMGLNSRDTVVKDEVLDGCKEPVYSKSSYVRWPLSNGIEAFNNHQAGEIQSSFFRPHFSGAPVNPQLLGGAPVRPSTGSFVARTTEPWYSLKAASSPAQLTIFYGGMVNVYDDITLEKAQAIMFLAGNGAFLESTDMAHPRAQAQAPAPMNPTQPGSVVSSPMSVSSHPVGQPPSGLANRDEAAKITKMDTPRIMTSLGQVMQSAIPQARKASLARFLEKRKERVMASVPYSVSKNSSNAAASSDAVVVASERWE